MGKTFPIEQWFSFWHSWQGSTSLLLEVWIGIEGIWLRRSGVVCYYFGLRVSGQDGIRNGKNPAINFVSGSIQGHIDPPRFRVL
jgi:hypothetical protein